MITRDRPWLVVLGSVLALTVGNGPIMQFTFGVFLLPVTQELGVTRGLGSLALTVGLFATALSLPLAGYLTDRLGPKRCGLLAVGLFSIGLAAVGLISNSIWTFMALFALTGVAASGQTPLPYMKAITSCFDRQRGFALALALTGVGIGTIILPMVAQRLVSAFGWRGGYVGLAALIALVAAPSLILFIPGSTKPVHGKLPNADLPGLTTKEALRTRQFWLLVLGLFLAAAAANGTIAHVVPMLVDRGVPPRRAVTALAWVGAASIAGRVFGGYLIDRFWAPLVSMIFFVGMAGGIVVLIFARTPEAASVATVLIGLGLGVEADLAGFLVSRYLGMKAFGALFGYVFGAFMLASSLGPVLMGYMFDFARSYTLCLAVFTVFTAAGAAAFLSMGPYRFPTAPHQEGGV